MSFVPLNSVNLQAFERRVQAVDAGRVRRWGSLEPAGMLVHLSNTLRVSLGDIAIEDRSTFFSRNIVRRLAFQTPVPWPKGKIKAPDIFTPPPKGTLEECRAELIAEMKRFIECAEREPRRSTLHPMFGPFTLKFWQHAHGKHFNHHFEQFGV